jgi:Tol biopolymer transport system component
MWASTSQNKWFLRRTEMETDIHKQSALSKRKIIRMVSITQVFSGSVRAGNSAAKKSTVHGLLIVIVFLLLCLNNAIGAPLVFVSDRAGSRDIWRMNDVGLHRLTSYSGFEDYPVPSPDGRQVAFVSDHGTTGSEIYVVNSDGSNIQRLTSYGASYCTQPAWSPDGSTITFVRSIGGRTYLESVPSNGSSAPSALTQDGWCRYNPEYRPDGSRILYDRDNGAAGWWNLCDADTTSVPFESQELVLAGRNHSVGGQYSNDGTQIAYIDVLGSRSQVRRMNADGTDNVLLVDNSSIAYDGWGQATWSPDDRFLAVSIYPSMHPGVPEFNPFIQILDAVTGEEIYRIGDGKNTFVIESSRYGDRHFVAGNSVWNENSELAFMSDFHGAWDIYAILPDGGGLRNLTSSPSWDGHAAWIIPEPSTVILLGLGALALVTGQRTEPLT